MRVEDLATVQDVDAAVRVVRAGVTDKHEKALLGEFRMHKWRGNSVYALEYGAVAGALIAVGYGKRTPKLNVYTLFTAPAWRGQSCMTVLLDFVEVQAKTRGLTHAVSKASSLASVHLYAKRGYHLYLPTEKGEVPVWWDLTGEQTAPSGALDPYLVGKLCETSRGLQVGYQLEIPFERTR